MTARAGLTTGFYAVVSPTGIGPFGNGRYVAFYKENRMARLRSLCEGSPASVVWVSDQEMMDAVEQGNA